MEGLAGSAHGLVRGMTMDHLGSAHNLVAHVL